jgi:tRNA A-37 threonylcarbamoyl transferase component Bud32
MSRALQQRLPWPLALYWLRALRARTAREVYDAAERSVTALTALVLAEAVHASWPPKMEEALAASHGALDKPSFGKRIGILRAVAALHRHVPEPILAGVGDWFDGVDGATGLLQSMVERRNVFAHGAPPLSEAEERAALREAQEQLASLLTTARFLNAAQLLHVDGEMRTERGRTRCAVRRLSGRTPYAELPFEADWSPRDLVVETGRIYLVNAAGTRWLLHPFLRLEDGGKDTGGEPRPVVFSSVDRRGRIAFEDPRTGDLSTGGTVPDEDWRPVGWTEFLARRQDIVPGWAQANANAHANLVWAARDLADGLTPGLVLDHFRLIEVLGEGGAGVVWRVEDTDDEQSYALKVLKAAVAADAVEVRRFDEEVRTMKRLYASGCDRVVGPVVAFRVGAGEEQRIALRMPLMTSTLKDAAAELRAVSGLDAAVVIGWARQALEALAQIHAQKVVHRDIKPSNFLLDAAGRVWLADLGVARDAARRSDLTRTGDVIGTDVYMAPEQRIGSRDVGPAADLYALAVTLDELLHGAVRLTPGRGVDGQLGEALRAMARHEPSERPSAVEVLALLSGSSARMAVHAPSAREATVPDTSSAPTDPVSELPNSPIASRSQPRFGRVFSVGATMLLGAFFCAFPFIWPRGCSLSAGRDMPAFDPSAQLTPSVWTGRVTQFGVIALPFTLELCPAPDGTVTGTINWTALAERNPVSGGWKGNEITVMEGGGGTSSGSVKTARISGDQMIGTDDGGTTPLEAHRIEMPPSTCSGQVDSAGRPLTIQGMMEGAGAAAPREGTDEDGAPAATE